MYKKDKPITMKWSSSHLCNNLSVNVVLDKRKLNYAVVHKSVVNIVCATSDGSIVTGRQMACKEPSIAQGLPFIMQAKWVILPSRPLLVLTSQRGIQMFEPDSLALIHWHSLSDSVEKSNYGKGITGFGENAVCVGTEAGEILVFHVPSKGTNVTLEDTTTKHTSSVSDLTSDKDFVASADDSGTIIVWKHNDCKLSPMTTIKGSGWPCNSIALWKGILVGGFASGHLRIYNATTGLLGAEVTAHARAINAIDISKENGMLISVSDDTFFRIWQLRALNVPQIEFSYSQCVTDLQLVGACFVDGQGKALCVTGYDGNEIMFFVNG